MSFLRTVLAGRPSGAEDDSLRGLIVQGATWALLGRVAGAGGVMAVNVLLTRLLSPNDAGIYFLAFSMALLGSILAQSGLPATIVRIIPEAMSLRQPRRAKLALYKASVMSCVCALTVGVLLAVSSPTMMRLVAHSPQRVSVAALVGAWAAFLSLQEFCARAFQAFYDIARSSLFSGVASNLVCAVALTLVWLHQGRCSLATALALSVLSSAGTTLIAAALVRQHATKLAGDKGSVSSNEIISRAWPILCTSLSYELFNQSDLWIIGASRSSREIAVYGAAWRLVTLVAVPLSVVNAFVSPLIAEFYTKRRLSDLERGLRATATVAGLPALVVLLVFMGSGRIVLEHLYGPFYRSGALVLVLLSLGQCVNVWAGSCGLTLIMTGHQRMAMNITLANGVARVALAIVLVSKVGIEGVALAAALGIALQNLLLVVAAKLALGIWTHFDVGHFANLYSEINLMQQSARRARLAPDQNQ